MKTLKNLLKAALILAVVKHRLFGNKTAKVDDLKGFAKWFRHWKNKRELRRLYKKIGSPHIRF
jgi:hypothetical protein